jgi:hypothetical protein
MSILLSTTFPSLTDASPGGGCDHTSPDNDSFPLIHLEPYVFILSSGIPYFDAVKD